MGGGASLPATAVACITTDTRPYLQEPRLEQLEIKEVSVVVASPVSVRAVATGDRDYLQQPVDAKSSPVGIRAVATGGRDYLQERPHDEPKQRVVEDGRKYLEEPLDTPITDGGAFGYELSKPEELVRFLREANVVLVRGKYLAQLIERKETLPRRQEAELDGDAFVTDSELEEWIGHLDLLSRSLLAPFFLGSSTIAGEYVLSHIQGTRRPVIWAISHSWESMEHADPFGFQIHRLKEGFEKTPALGLKMFHEAWFFYDYVCLYQFKREEDSQEGSFRSAMNNMHVLYAHECTRTISIQKATPTSWMDLEKLIPIYNLETGKVEQKPIKSLKLNPTPYVKRGWTQAELLWSSSRTQVLSIPEWGLSISGCTTDAALLDGEANATAQRAEVPVTPEIFQLRAEELQFTHRADLEPVIQLQAKVFNYKASSAISLSLLQLTAEDMETLSAALPYYKLLRSLRVSHFELTSSAAKSLQTSLVEAAGSLTSISLTDCWKPCVELAMAMAQVLKGRGSLEHLDLTGCSLTAEGCEALAEVLKDDQVSVQQLVLMDLKDENGDGSALAKALQSNSSVLMLQLYGTSLSPSALHRFLRCASLRTLGFGPRFHGPPRPRAAAPWRLKDLGDEELLPAIQAMAQGVEENQTLLQLDLSFSGLEDVHAQLLAKALKKNLTLNLLDLRTDDPPFSEETIRQLTDAWGQRSLEDLLLSP